MPNNKNILSCFFILFCAITFQAHASEKVSRNDIFQKESKAIDYYNVNNNAINFYIYGNNYGDMSLEEIDKNKNILNNIVNSTLVKRWISDKQLENNDIDDIYEYNNEMLNTLAVTKSNENNVIAVNPIRINKDEDKIGGNNYWFNIIMIPKILFNNNYCIGSILIFSPNSCVILPDRWNELINEYMSEELNYPLDGNFVWSFISVHELSHSLPYQLNLRIFTEREDEFEKNPKKYQNIETYYKEVYADMYATIKMLNYGYSKEDVKGIILMRKISLFLYDDIDHYTAPYIQLLLDEPSINYKNLKGLSEINDYINTIFIKGFNLGYAPNIKLYNQEMTNMKPFIRKLNSFLLNLLSATDKTDDKTLEKFIKEFNTRVYFSNARLRVRIDNP